MACSCAFFFADNFQLSSAMCLTRRASGAKFSSGIILRVFARHLQTLATAKHIWGTQTFGKAIGCELRAVPVQAQSQGGESTSGQEEYHFILKGGGNEDTGF